ncbi:hypothetical protein [Lactobacillus helveticus]|uniref:hypothetical protein n=1 Tax=Lactobacillus helveticus TaxID=1587 RepID=UPI0021A543B9|nr:hypothetical protein [Lactobacillus helveticus]
MAIFGKDGTDMTIHDVLETVKEKEHEFKDNILANSGQSWSCTSSCKAPTVFD